MLSDDDAITVHCAWIIAKSMNSREYYVYYIGDFNLTIRGLSTTYFQANNCLCVIEWVLAAWKLCEVTVFCHNSVSWHYKLVCVHMSGEVGSFKAHFTALIAGAEFMNILKSYIKKTFGLLVLWTRCISPPIHRGICVCLLRYRLLWLSILR